MTLQIGFHGANDSRTFPTSSIGYFRLAARCAKSDNSDMADDEKSWLVARVEGRLAAIGKKPIPAATGAGLGRDFITDILNGRKKSVSGSNLTKLAFALECPPGFLTDPDFEILLDSTDDGRPPAAPFEAMTPTGDPVDLRSVAPFLRPLEPPPLSKSLARIRPIDRAIPVLGEVAAGVWRETSPRDMREVEDFLPMDVQGYERATLFALKVVGPSVNLVYPPGRFVVVAPAHQAGIRDGDFVVVERAKLDLVEVTIKELRYEDGKIALWPRSSDPRYQEPIYLKGDDDDQLAPRIIGVVVADYNKRERPPISQSL